MPASIVTSEGSEHSREDPSLMGIIRSHNVFVTVSSSSSKTLADFLSVHRGFKDAHGHKLFMAGQA
ncbi:hypothetical protein Asppvi_010739 [Aspergillus pseudoviridinutans]|uniref:Uncharacterized protein n=1 Tax=Aspergillus pseudoviridinutans TaxID=1517512 RepID=A0A9P3EXB5_9EURO|nr:uncharacterized protein Asppvi_010739 [Aspergillus pseudoviridinutans]GIJ91766.1 hypothetical protein Asppvi_010739 [Aspergillus pseudoviridinutans]